MIIAFAFDDKTKKLEIQEKLATHLEMKELGKLKYFLGIKTSHSRKGIFISKGKLRYTTTRLPTEQNHKIGSKESPHVRSPNTRDWSGKLIYLSQTRSNITYILSLVSQFMHDPRERHLQAIERIFIIWRQVQGKDYYLEEKAHCPWTNTLMLTMHGQSQIQD